jgi:hypothetical protein
VGEGEQSDAVCVRFRLTRGEYQAAMMRLCWGLWFYRGVAALSAMALVAGIALLLTDDADLGIPLIGLAIVWSALLGWVLFLKPVRQYHQQARLRDEQSHCFADDGVTVSFSDGQSQVKWTFYEMLTESNGLYLLRHQKGVANVIPRRAFDSGEEEGRFRQLAQRHLKVDFRRQAATV